VIAVTAPRDGTSTLGQAAEVVLKTAAAARASLPATISRPDPRR